MKKNIKKILPIISSILLIALFLIMYNDYRVKHAKIKVELVDNLDVQVYSDIKLKNLIKKINGKLITNKKINTKKIGEQKISFKYINEEKIKVSYSFKVKVVDTTPPFINNIKNITLIKNSNIDLKSNFFCGDNYDKHPTCEIIGNYDLDKIGDYNLTYKAVDNSDIKKNLNKDRTKIGIDVSHHQGDIDYEKIKQAGAEFVILRVGSQKGKNGEYYIDNKFIDNIKGFNKVKIPVGIYFFSYADSKKEAVKQADWVINQVRQYKIELPIAFDWEDWSDYQKYDLSFYQLTQIANAFTQRINEKGYRSMLYSSKNYLEKVWINPKSTIWLAHYTSQTNYKGDYKIWQICDDGIIDGIYDNTVDIDIMY